LFYAKIILRQNYFTPKLFYAKNDFSWHVKATRGPGPEIEKKSKIN